jgi:hypothetical protein
MFSISWNKRGIILVDILEWSHTISPAHYVEALKKMNTLIAKQTPEKKGKFFLQHDNARPHTSILTRKTTAEFAWTVLLHLLHSPDLAPSRFHQFCPIKDGLHGKHFANDNAVTVAIKKWLLKADSNSY